MLEGGDIVISVGAVHPYYESHRRLLDDIPGLSMDGYCLLWHPWIL